MCNRKCDPAVKKLIMILPKEYFNPVLIFQHEDFGWKKFTALKNKTAMHNSFRKNKLELKVYGRAIFGATTNGGYRPMNSTCDLPHKNFHQQIIQFLWKIQGGWQKNCMRRFCPLKKI
jgi:hypothetical protein